MYESIHYILPEDLDPLCNKDYNDEGASTIRCMSDRVSYFDQTVGRGVQTNSPMPEDAIAENDAIILNWFAGWAMTQLENFRKFHVIMAPGTGARGGGPGGAYEGGRERFDRQRKDWMKGWNHVREFF